MTLQSVLARSLFSRSKAGISPSFTESLLCTRGSAKDIYFASLSTACRANGTVQFLTKGDNNAVDDTSLYNPGQLWLEPKHLIGRAKAYVRSYFRDPCVICSFF